MQIPWHPHNAAEYLRVPTANSHKYSRGVLGVRTGSTAYPGAAVLGVGAAWRTGIGMVQFFPELIEAATHGARENVTGLPSPASAVLARYPETVIASTRAFELQRPSAWLLGSGTAANSQGFAESERLRNILESDRPSVVDAGALHFVAEVMPLAPTIVTPHLGEFWSLWQLAGLPDHTEQIECDLAEAALTLAAHLGVTVLLKGSVTLAATPTGTCFMYGPATPWLATAGTGDVLAGTLGALVASHAANALVTHDTLARLGVTAALLHDQAARFAAEHTDRPITASDLAESLPRAFAHVLAAKP